MFFIEMILIGVSAGRYQHTGKSAKFTEFF